MVTLPAWFIALTLYLCAWGFYSLGKQSKEIDNEIDQEEIDGTKEELENAKNEYFKLRARFEELEKKLAEVSKGTG